MKKKKGKHPVIEKRRKAAFLLLLLIVFLTLSTATATALPPGPRAQDKAETLVVVIQEKATGPRFIYVKERPFRVMPEASIQDSAGNPIPWKELRVPCKSRITFFLFGNNRYPSVTSIIRLD